MTENKRFKHTKNRMGMQFISYENQHILIGTFADSDGVATIVELLNTQNTEIQKLKQWSKCLSEKRHKEIKQ